MDKPLLLVDFDRTLSDTSAFIDFLWRSLAELYQVDGVAEQARSKEFYTYSGEWYDYDFFTHLAAISSVPEDVDTVMAAIRSRAEPDRFLYPDAQQLIPDIDAIVTFGNEPYQRFKLSFCPALSELQTHIIQSSKAEFISRQYGARPTVLVDDKHLENELPASVQFICIDRKQTEDLVVGPTCTSVNSLSVVASLHEKNGYDRMESL